MEVLAPSVPSYVAPQGGVQADPDATDASAALANMPNGPAGGTLSQLLSDWSMSPSIAMQLRPPVNGLGSAGNQQAQAVPGAAPAAAASAAPALPAGVDWNFIAQREGSRTDGYVPLDVHGKPDAKSGVTIAVGFDLGGRTVADLQGLGLPSDLVTTLTPYLGHHGQDAQNLLTKDPLNITSEQAQAINTSAFTSYYNRVADKYNAAQTTGTKFQDLPRDAQTAIVSVAYQYGTNLASATPKFWTQVTTGQWQAAHDNLTNFHDAYPTRRGLEAGLMQNAINSGNLPAPPAQPAGVPQR